MYIIYRFKILFAEKEGEEKGEGKRGKKTIFIFIFIYLIFEMSSSEQIELIYSLIFLSSSILFFSFQFPSLLFFNSSTSQQTR